MSKLFQKKSLSSSLKNAQIHTDRGRAAVFRVCNQDAEDGACRQKVMLYSDHHYHLKKHSQIETVQLSSECAIKTLEAELAGTKSSLAGFEASFKADKASWGADLEGAKYEVRVGVLMCMFWGMCTKMR